jgi:Caspase domain
VSPAVKHFSERIPSITTVVEPLYSNARFKMIRSYASIVINSFICCAVALATALLVGPSVATLTELSSVVRDGSGLGTVLNVTRRSSCGRNTHLGSRCGSALLCSHLRRLLSRSVLVAVCHSLVVSTLWLATVQIAAADEGRRVALVIGNADYQSVARLDNPRNDARLMAQTLARLGFSIVGGGPQLNLEKPAFDKSVQEFGRAIIGADVALFYYSGHGLQVQGVNWLVPVDANPTRLQDLDFQMISADLVLRQMRDARTRLNIMVLDACRNNPFGSRGLRAAGGGLAEMTAPEGTLISYATQPGSVARDGSGTNSPFTAALAKAMQQPGLDIFRVFNQVGLGVQMATDGEQQPWVASSPISGEFYFAGPVVFNAPVTIQPAAPSVDADALFWESILNSGSAEDYRTYLKEFPTGRFTALARRRLADLAAPATKRAPKLATFSVRLPSHAEAQTVRRTIRKEPKVVRFLVMKSAPDGNCAAGVHLGGGPSCTVSVNECRGIAGSSMTRDSAGYWHCNPPNRSRSGLLLPVRVLARVFRRLF